MSTETVTRAQLERWQAWLRRASELLDAGRIEPADIQPVLSEIQDTLAKWPEEPDPDDGREWYLTSSEFGARYGLSRSVVSMMVNTRGFPVIRYGKRGARIRMPDAHKWLLAYRPSRIPGPGGNPAAPVKTSRGSERG